VRLHVHACPRPSLSASARRRKRFRGPPLRHLQAPGPSTLRAADALVNAAGKFDVAALTEIFGPDGDDVVLTGEFAQDRKRAVDFAAKAREKQRYPWTERAGIEHSCSWEVRTVRFRYR
jgi:hypothetical protein